MRIVLMLIALLIVGCERPNPTPEILDPIFQDLKAQIAQAEADLAFARADLDKARTQLAEAQPQTRERSRSMEAIARAQRALIQAEQKKHFLEIRLEKRQKTDRKEYLKAFSEKKPWPPPEEKTQYQTFRRLQTASRNWDERVPKSREVLAKRSPPKAKPKAEDKGGGH